MTNASIFSLDSAVKRLSADFKIDIPSFAAPAGCILGLIGPNGAGKSTLLRLLTGMLTPDSGSVHIFDKVVPAEATEVKRWIGYVPDSISIYPWMSIDEALRFCGACYPSWSGQRADELCKAFQLLPSTKVANLSKGMQTKLNLVVAMGHQPKLILWDEPFIGLDPIGRKSLISMIRSELGRNGQTLVISSHDLADVESLSDQVAIMHLGKILVHERMETLLDSVVRIQFDTDVSGKRLPSAINVIRHQNLDGVSVVTIGNYTSSTVDLLQREQFSVRETHRLSLSDIFEDFNFGAEKICCSN